MAEIDRTEYRSDHGVARWLSKDGAWHVAVQEADGVARWTPTQYETRDQAIATLNSQ